MLIQGKFTYFLIRFNTLPWTFERTPFFQYGMRVERGVYTLLTSRWDKKLKFVLKICLVNYGDWWRHWMGHNISRTWTELLSRFKFLNKIALESLTRFQNESFAYEQKLEKSVLLSTSEFHLKTSSHSETWKISYL